MSTIAPSDETFSANKWRYVWIPLAGILLTLAAIVGRSYDTRIDHVDNRVTGVQTELRDHKDNMTIHRTSEEARAVEKLDAEFRENVNTQLEYIRTQIDDLRRRTR